MGRQGFGWRATPAATVLGLRREAQRHAAFGSRCAHEKRCSHCALPPQSKSSLTRLMVNGRKPAFPCSGHSGKWVSDGYHSAEVAGLSKRREDLSPRPASQAMWKPPVVVSKWTPHPNTTNCALALIEDFVVLVSPILTHTNIATARTVDLRVTRYSVVFHGVSLAQKLTRPGVWTGREFVSRR